jgi:hypothetical protein
MQVIVLIGVTKGIRTPVTAVKEGQARILDTNLDIGGQLN